MLCLADFHTHLYPDYQLSHGLAVALKNLDQLAKGVPYSQTTKLLFLTERYDCNAFSELRDGKLKIHGFEVKACLEECALVLESHLEDPLFIFAGRQIATKERLEVLALVSNKSFTDGEPLQQSFQKVKDSGAIPVLNWAPGKWLGRRGKLISGLIKSEPKSYLCDTALRPSCWPEPAQYREARKLGNKILGGTDPLPLVGEEIRLGLYGSCFDCDFDPQRPVSSIRTALYDPSLKLDLVGKRLGPLAVAVRLLKLKFAR